MPFATRWHHPYDLFLMLAFSLLAQLDRAVAHDLRRVGRVRGSALVAVGAMAPDVCAALDLAALRLVIASFSTSRCASCASVGSLAFLYPLVACVLWRVEHIVEAYHLHEDVAPPAALLGALGAKAALLYVRSAKVIAR